MVLRILASVMAVLAAAALTLASLIVLVMGTISAVSIEQTALRVLAVAADLILGTLLLLACVYLAIHLTVRIIGVGHAEFPPPPTDKF